MKYADIITLAQAGFTAQQIAQMALVEAAPAPQSAPAPVPPERAPTPAAGTPPTPVPATTTPPADQLTAILAEMQTLKQTVQAQNRQNAELIPPAPQSAQDILASIIAPPKTGEK